MLFPRLRHARPLFLAGWIAFLAGHSPAAAQSPDARTAANRAYAQGKRAEQAGNWEEAFQDYSAAARAFPNNHDMELQREFARSELVRGLTGQAEREILNGQNDKARAILEAALALDPSYTVARERLGQITAPATPAAPTIPAEARLASSPPKLQARPGMRTFDFRGTTRAAYEELARQFGVTAAFDPDLVDRNLRFIAPDVDFETALRLLSEQTVTFWRSVDAHTFFVAADSPDKRRAYEPEIEQTILLPASETNDEMTETSRMVRDIVGLRRSQLDLKAHALTVRDTLANVALAKALVEDVEQSHGQALLEIDILEVDSQLGRQMGVTPPTSASVFTLSSAQVQQLEAAPNVGTLGQILQTIFGAQNPLAGAAGSLVPPLIAFGGGKSIFLATLPGASATLLQTLSLVKSAQRVLLRIEDGRPATFFVGEHFPITLALLSEGQIAPATQFTPGILPGTFPRTDYNVGHTPSGAAIGDFNGDGKPDLAVVNTADNTVSVLLNNASAEGTFPTATTYATGRGPVAVITGDFNADGKQDLAVVNNCTVVATVANPCAAGDYSVSILLGNGDGTFGAATNYTVGTSPVALVSGTFNFKNNIFVDLAVVNQGANTVSILVGAGDGTFAPKQDFPVGNSPTAITTADFNNDGIADLAVTNHGANNFSVLPGKGDGTFGTQSNFTTGNGPSAIAAADFNLDGRQDVAVANETDNSVSVILGNGDGTFGTTTIYPTGTGPVALIASDFNLDGRPDLVVANETAATVSVFLGLGDGTLVSPLSLSVGNTPIALAVADLNGDGLPDLAVANQASNTVSVILNTASIPVSSSATQTAYPGSEYVDLGLKVRASPRMHPNDEVTLNLQFDISALAGQAVNGIPILSNRTIEQTVRLRENQTSVLSGILQSNETRTITGLPYLAEAGPLGYLAGLRGKQDSNTELLIAITPRQLQLAPRTDHSLYAGRGTGTAAPAAAPPGAAPIPGVPPPGQAPAQGTGAAPPGAVPPAGQPPPTPPGGNAPPTPTPPQETPPGVPQPPPPGAPQPPG